MVELRREGLWNESTEGLVKRRSQPESQVQDSHWLVGAGGLLVLSNLARLLSNISQGLAGKCAICSPIALEIVKAGITVTPANL